MSRRPRLEIRGGTEGSVGMPSIPPDSKRLTLMRSGWAPGDLCARVIRVAGGAGREGIPAVSVPSRPEDVTFGDPRRQRGPSGCYRYPLIVNGSP